MHRDIARLLVLTCISLSVLLNQSYRLPVPINHLLPPLRASSSEDGDIRPTATAAAAPHIFRYHYRYIMIPDVNGDLCSVRYIDVDAAPTNNKREDEVIITPLVLFLGTGQTVDSFAQHVQPISSQRRLIIIELRGQGQTQLDAQYCTMSQYVADIRLIFEALQVDTVHLCGFSFGGRVGLAFASLHPAVVEKLSITAVPLTRPSLGKLILDSCCDSLQLGHLRECAWSLVLNGYSEDYLNKHGSRMEGIVNALVANNNAQSMYNLIRLSNVDNSADEFSSAQCCRRLNNSLSVGSTLYSPQRRRRMGMGMGMMMMQVIAGSRDRIAGWDPVRELSGRVDKSLFVSIDSGHLCPFEAPTLWRSELMRFIG